MRPHPHPGQIRPQVSTMPRPQTEASAYLDIYKLVNEKKRLRQELEAMEQRRDLIQQRLTTIETQINQLEQNAHNLRQEAPSEKNNKIEPQPHQDSNFNTLFLEY